MTEFARSASVPRAPAHDRVHLLDGPYVSHGAQRLTVPEGAERMLVYVALRGGSAESRRRIAGTLWPTVGESRAAGNLRTALWRLRSAGIRCLDDDRHALRIRDGVTVDVLEADAWAGRLVEGTAHGEDLTLRRYHAASVDLLPDWDDEWLVVERERLRQRMLHALEELALRLAERARYAEAIEAAMRSIGIDPLRESAHRALILAHLAEGNVVEARRAYAMLERLLDRELGVAPAPATAVLVDVVGAREDVRALGPR